MCTGVLPLSHSTRLRVAHRVQLSDTGPLELVWANRDEVEPGARKRATNGLCHQHLAGSRGCLDALCGVDGETHHVAVVTSLDVADVDADSDTKISACARRGEAGRAADRILGRSEKR